MKRKPRQSKSHDRKSGQNGHTAADNFPDQRASDSIEIVIPTYLQARPPTDEELLLGSFINGPYARRHGPDRRKPNDRRVSDDRRHF